MALLKSRNFKAERAARATSRNNPKENSPRPKSKLEPKFLYGHKVHFMAKEKRLKNKRKAYFWKAEVVHPLSRRHKFLEKRVPKLERYKDRRFNKIDRYIDLEYKQLEALEQRPTAVVFTLKTKNKEISYKDETISVKTKHNPENPKFQANLIFKNVDGSDNMLSFSQKEIMELWLLRRLETSFSGPVGKWGVQDYYYRARAVLRVIYALLVSSK
mgnify:FL=1